MSAATAAGRCLIVPSDLLVREFDAKLLFACAAAERGFSAIVGSKLDMYRSVAAWPRGCYIHKDVHSRPGLLKRLRRLGQRVVAWDEEGLVNVSPERYRLMRVSGRVLGLADALFAWGRENATAWQQCPDYPGNPIHVTGNPRGDLLRPELHGYFDDEVQALRRRFGRFVLVNTNFGFVNNVVTKSVRNFDVEWRRRAASADGFMDGFIDFRGRIFREFLAMVPRLADGFPATTVVVRPHPTEDHSAWLQAAEGRRNVQVLHEGNATPWLLAAEAVVHNGCSTGLEAHLLGRPAVAYLPFTSERYDIPLPNAVSHQVDTGEALLDAVAAILGGSWVVGEAEASRRDAVVAQHIAGLDSTLASDRILDIVERLPPVSGSLPAELWRWLRKSVLKRRDGSERSPRDALKRPRFPDTPVEAVERRVERLRRCLGRFHEVEVRGLAQNVFQVARR